MTPPRGLSSSYVSITLMAGTDDENAEATLIVTNLALKYNR